ncbi:MULTISPECIES: hydroxypyruvate isomerase family protein [unclassified Microbacterium]|uniref:hydroxypyruvate isomerase family protein n=1 Tax=unclassified Microbacterium TaxID=2609290 RepID=UPI00364991C0
MSELDRDAKPLRFDANLKWLFTELPFERRFDAASSAGFAAVECPAPYSLTPSGVSRRLRDAGLELILINTPMGAPGSVGQRGFACLPEHVREFRESFSQGLEYAAALGSTFLHVVGGSVPSDLSRDQAIAQYIASVAWAVDQAEGSGVGIVIEMQNRRDSPGFVLESHAQAAAIAAATGAGLLLDLYHVQISEGDVTRRFRELLPLVAHLQIADAPTRHEPGTGELNWRFVFQAIADSTYDGWIGCEYAPSLGTTPGLAWMKELTP